jgi:hypothetical protein
MDEFGQSPLGESSKRLGSERCAIDNNNRDNDNKSKRELCFDGPGDVSLGERDNSCGQLEEADLYGDLFDQEREGVGILRLKVSKVRILGIYDIDATHSWCFKSLKYLVLCR